MENFASKYAFIMAAVGSAVGLGNIFRFPALAARYGIWFIIFYILALFAVGLPLLWAELCCGRSGASADKRLSSVKWGGALNCFLVLGCYMVFFALVIKRAAGSVLSDLSEKTDPLFLLAALSAALLCFGSTEKLAKVSEVGVIFSTAVLFVVAVAGTAKAPAALGDFFRISPRVVLSPDFFAAVCGQVFFSLSLAVGVMTAYGSMLDKNAPILKCGLWVCLFDLAVSLLSTVIYICLGGREGNTTQSLSVYPEIFSAFFGEKTGRAVGAFFFTGLALLCLDSVIAYVKAIALLTEREGRAGVLVAVGAAVFGLFLLGDGYGRVNFIDSRLLPPVGLAVGAAESVIFSFVLPRAKERRSIGLALRFFIPALLIFMLLRKIFT